MKGGSVHSSLSIKTTDRSDSAVYTCVATNAFGSADTNINLIIQGLFFSYVLGVRTFSVL